MEWTLKKIIERIQQIEAKGFISISDEMYRSDEGAVGQILEREFGVPENNQIKSDLGTFELKGMRERSQTLTLCHQSPQKGMTPLEIFGRFGYVRPSRRDPGILKKKLFTTVKGGRNNNLGLVLTSSDTSEIEMFHNDEFICQWDLSERLPKMSQVVLAVAETRGAVNSRAEQFHYIKADLLIGLKDLDGLIADGAIVIDFCIDQVVGSGKGPHDRGPHIRIPKSKLRIAYGEIRRIFEV